MTNKIIAQSIEKEELHKTTAPFIYDYSFGGYMTMTDVSNQIYRDKAFDRKCYENDKKRDRINKHKNEENNNDK